MSQIPPPISPPPPSPGPVGYGAPAPKQTNGAAIGSLISGVLGCVPFVTGIAAIILGVIGLKKAKDPNVGGKPLAVIGLILGLLSILGWTLFFGSLAVGVGAVAKLSEPGRTVAKDWMTATSAGNIEKAASLSVDAFPRDDIQTIADHVKQFGAFQDMTSNSINLQNSTLTLIGNAKFANGSRAYTIIVVDTGGGTWKVQSVKIE